MMSLLYNSVRFMRHIRFPVHCAVCRGLPQRSPLTLLSRSLATKAKSFKGSKHTGERKEGGQKVKSQMAKSELLSEDEATEVMNNLTDKRKTILKLLQAEYDYLFSSWVQVPMTVTNRMWAEMISLVEQDVGDSGRQKTWRWYSIKEGHNLKKIHGAKVQSKEPKEPSPSEEGPKGRDNRYLYINENNIESHQNHQILHAQQFGRQIVFDCGFEESMGMQELRSCVRQLLIAHSYNKNLKDPFFLNFCNLEPDSHTWSYLQHFHSGQKGQSFEEYSKLLYLFTPRDFTEIFPREDLVMLSPDAQHNLYEVRPDKVYIIGAITDRANSKPLTMSKAKRLGIPCFKLPLHLQKYVESIFLIFNIIHPFPSRWGGGPRKDLGLNVVLEMLQMVGEGNSWEDTMTHCLPARCTGRTESPPIISPNSIVLY